MKYGNLNNLLYGVVLPLSPRINPCVVVQSFFISGSENYQRGDLLALHTA